MWNDTQILSLQEVSKNQLDITRGAVAARTNLCYAATINEGDRDVSAITS